jgi:hypothetical protein
MLAGIISQPIMLLFNQTTELITGRHGVGGAGDDKNVGLLRPTPRNCDPN